MPQSPNNQLDARSSKEILMPFEYLIENNQSFFNDKSTSYCGWLMPKGRRKASNAFKSYVAIDGCDHDCVPLVLIDDTLLGSAKEGLYVTDNRIYGRTAASRPEPIYLFEIESIAFTEQTLSINGKAFITFSQPKVNKFVSSLVNLIKAYLSQKSKENCNA